MASTLDNLVVNVVFRKDTKGLDQATKSLDKFKTNALKIGASILAVFGGTALFNNIAKNADEMGKFAASTGIAVEELGALEFAAKRTGVETGTLRSSIQNLARVLGEAGRGQGDAAATFARYGIEIRKSNGELKNSAEFLSDLNRAFQDLNAAQRFDLAAKAGISPELVRLLGQTPREFNKLRKEAIRLGVVNEEEAKAAAEYRDSLTNLNQALTKLGSTLGRALFPVVSQFVEFLTNMVAWVRRNSAALIAGAKAAGVFFLAFTPVGQIATGILALIAIIEDLYSWFTGGPSAFAQWFGPMETLRELINGVVSIISELFKISKTLFPVIKALARVFATGLVAALKFAVSGLNAVVKAVTFVIDKVKQFFGIVDKGRNQEIDAIEKIRINTPAVDLNKITAGQRFGGSVNLPGGRSVTNTVNVGGIEINAPGSSSQEISNQIQGQLNVALKNTIEDTDSTIAR